MSRFIKELKRLHVEWFKKEYPLIPVHAIPAPKYSVKNANELTKCIKAYVNLRGGRVYRVNVQGQYDAKLRKWRQGGSDRGIPDLIGAGPGGLFLGIEVKFGKDQLSEHQTKVINQLSDVGGIVFVARDFDNFCEWFEQYFYPQPL